MKQLSFQSQWRTKRFNLVKSVLQRNFSSPWNSSELQRNRCFFHHWIFRIFIKFWKIVNVKAPGEDQRLNDTARAVIQSSEDWQLDFLMDISNMVKDMKPMKGSRIKCFTNDTSKFIHHTCKGLVNLTKHLLNCGNVNVLLGWFTMQIVLRKHLENWEWDPVVPIF